MIKVYFESKGHSELVATFEEEDIYMACLPSLEELAAKHRMVVTEEVIEIPTLSSDDFAKWSREALVDWLVHNDPNGVYADEDSLREFGNVVSKEEALVIINNQINGEDE